MGNRVPFGGHTINLEYLEYIFIHWENPLKTQSTGRHYRMPPVWEENQALVWINLLNNNKSPLTPSIPPRPLNTQQGGLFLLSSRAGADPLSRIWDFSRIRKELQIRERRREYGNQFHSTENQLWWACGSSEYTLNVKNIRNSCSFHDRLTMWIQVKYMILYWATSINQCRWRRRDRV